MHPNQLVIEVETVHAMVSQQSPALASWPVRPVALEGTVNAIFRLGDGLVTRFPLQADDPAPFARGWKLVPLWQPVPHPLQLLPRHAAVVPIDLVWEPRRHLGGFGGQRRGRLLQSPVGGEPLSPWAPISVRRERNSFSSARVTSGSYPVTKAWRPR